ncbi:MAG: RNA methyltransferase [Bdellovibrionota bacterium]
MPNSRLIYVVLLHSPMVDRAGKEVTTAVTNLDIHDIARSCKTYGITKYFIVNPEVEQERMVRMILDHWKTEVSWIHHPSRAQALELVRFTRSFEEAFNEASLEGNGPVGRPFVVMPDAKDLEGAWSYRELREKLQKAELPGDENGRLRPLMIVFGTGWGISPKFYDRVDRPLKPLRCSSQAKYNHLSVRAAAAVVLDRVFGDHEN